MNKNKNLKLIVRIKGGLGNQLFSYAAARRLALVNQAEFKRYQTPPILRVSPKAFGPGRRIPIVGKYLT
jgi:NAD+ synthase (glutamine-hydrolysing)